MSDELQEELEKRLPHKRGLVAVLRSEAEALVKELNAEERQLASMEFLAGNTKEFMLPFVMIMRRMTKK